MIIPYPIMISTLIPNQESLSSIKGTASNKVVMASCMRDSNYTIEMMKYLWK